MTWLQAYGRSGAAEELAKGAAPGSKVFTGSFTPGTGPLTLVLLPALFVGDYMWERVHDAARAAGWPVVRFVEPIGMVDRGTTRSITRMAARLLEVTRSLAEPPYVVAGDSLGGLIAFELARAFPDEIAGLVASGAPGLNPNEDTFGLDIMAGSTRPEHIAEGFLEKLFHDPAAQPIDPDYQAKMVAELSRPAHILAIMSALKAIDRYNSRKIVMELSTPKLFVWGRQDEITPVEAWLDAVPHMQRARIEVIDECGHGPMFEKPEEYSRELLAFLASLAELGPSAG